MLALGFTARMQPASETQPETTRSPARTAAVADADAAREPRFPVHIHQPRGMPRVDSGKRDASGQPVLVSCATCHNTRPPNLENREGRQLEEFHRGLQVNHGRLACLACHDPGNYDRLRLADGTSLPVEQVMQLCAQCHGPQVRDYEHGSHGGMVGYWDRTRGPRTRNHCIDCHDAHAPQYPAVRPVFPPRDRFAPVPVHSPHAQQPGGE